jgi:antitoxin PrlF
MPTAIVTSKGQITIPQPVRERLGVVAGDRVEFVELADGQFALVPAIEDVRSLKGMVPKPGTPLSVEQMGRIIANRGAGQ